MQLRVCLQSLQLLEKKSEIHISSIYLPQVVPGSIRLATNTVGINRQVHVSNPSAPNSPHYLIPHCVKTCSATNTPMKISTPRLHRPMRISAAIHRMFQIFIKHTAVSIHGVRSATQPNMAPPSYH